MSLSVQVGDIAYVGDKPLIVQKIYDDKIYIAFSLNSSAYLLVVPQ